jgi:hypothetical protein
MAVAAGSEAMGKLRKIAFSPERLKESNSVTAPIYFYTAVLVEHVNCFLGLL